LGVLRRTEESFSKIPCDFLCPEARRKRKDIKKHVTNTNIQDGKENATNPVYRLTTTLIYTEEILAFSCN
jgi:hypothetical protein